MRIQNTYYWFFDETHCSANYCTLYLSSVTSVWWVLYLNSTNKCRSKENSACCMPMIVLEINSWWKVYIETSGKRCPGISRYCQYDYCWTIVMLECLDAKNVQSLYLIFSCTRPIQYVHFDATVFWYFNDCLLITTCTFTNYCWRLQYSCTLH